jgi:hypothetical protein
LSSSVGDIRQHAKKSKIKGGRLLPVLFALDFALTGTTDKVKLALKMYDSKQYSITEINKATGVRKTTL